MRSGTGPESALRQGSAPDPIAAFSLVHEAFTDGPPLSGEELPGHHVHAAMAAWTVRPLPLGEECLLTLDSDSGPLHAPQLITTLPGVGDVLDDLVTSRVALAGALQTLRRALAAYAAGEPLNIQEN